MTSAAPGSPAPSISDTAHWVALYRAQESERPDALFRDPFARRLAGERGQHMLAAMEARKSPSWPFIARTLLFDRFIAQEVAAGVDTVVNLAAGLDARPYRMDLPRALRWFEIDFPGVIEHKARVLAGEKPRCALERIALDLADEPARRAAFERIGAGSRKAMAVCEGLLIYLPTEQVSSLARDLAAVGPFQRWAVDIGSPGLLKILRKRMGPTMRAGPTELKFAPPEGPAFFEPLGWKPVEVRTLLQTAATAKRLPFILRLFARLPQDYRPPGKRPWGGACLLARK